MLMWIGERITEKGVGNGISIVLAVNIISRIPSDMTTLYENFIKGKTIAKGTLAGVIIFAIILVVVVFVLILNGAERRIPVQYSREDGRKKDDGRSVHQYSAESQHCRRYPDHLCFFHYVLPGRYRAVCR